MENKHKFTLTELSEHDRKVLAKYTGFYSNFIESNTAKSEIYEDEKSKPER